MNAAQEYYHAALRSIEIPTPITQDEIADTLLQYAGELTADSQERALVLRFIRDTGCAGINRTKLFRKTEKRMDSGKLTENLAILIATREIRQTRKRCNQFGPARTVYYYNGDNHENG